jgi:hypothetical protein
MSFMDWWRSTNELDLGLVRKGFNSMTIFWSLDSGDIGIVVYFMAMHQILQLPSLRQKRKEECGRWLEQKGLHP